MSGGSSKQQLIAQMLMAQQQPPATQESHPSTNKLKGRLKRLAEQNHQLKQRLGQADRQHKELLEYLDCLLELNQHFAAAVGACDCWGDDEDCENCQGAGTPGWQPVVEEAFKVYVAPALKKKTSGDQEVVEA